MSRPFEVTREIVLPASPEDVWTAIVADKAAWMFPTGPAATGAGGPVEIWEPPHHLTIRIQLPGDTFNALDYVIEARDGGTAHLRYVHSGSLPDGWENELAGIGPHTDFYLHTLGEYLRHYNGRAVTYVGQPTSGIEGPEAAGAADAMDTLRAALGGPSAVGDEVHTTLGDAGALDGVVDYATPEFLGVRTEDGLYRFFGRNHFGGVVGLSAHLFVDGVDAASHEAALKTWLDSRY